MKKLLSIICIMCLTLQAKAMQSPFLDLWDFNKVNHHKKATFLDQNNNKTKCKYKSIADPSYDQTFKKIFSWENEVNAVSGAMRIKSLLNSIFYPNAGDRGFKIRKVEPLHNESTRINEKTQLGVLKFDVACRCSCWSNRSVHKIKIFDIEMQTGYEADFIGRLFDYGNEIRKVNNHTPVMILAFLNYSRMADDTCSTELFYINQQGEAINGAVENGY